MDGAEPDPAPPSAARSRRVASQGCSVCRARHGAQPGLGITSGWRRHCSCTRSPCHARWSLPHQHHHDAHSAPVAGVRDRQPASRTRDRRSHARARHHAEPTTVVSHRPVAAAPRAVIVDLSLLDLGFTGTPRALHDSPTGRGAAQLIRDRSRPHHEHRARTCARCRPPFTAEARAEPQTREGEAQPARGTLATRRRLTLERPANSFGTASSAMTCAQVHQRGRLRTRSRLHLLCQQEAAVERVVAVDADTAPCRWCAASVLPATLRRPSHGRRPVRDLP
jgi:hypothetical protein